MEFLLVSFQAWHVRRVIAKATTQLTGCVEHMLFVLTLEARNIWPPLAWSVRIFLIGLKIKTTSMMPSKLMWAYMPGSWGSGRTPGIDPVDRITSWIQMSEPDSS